MIDLNDFKEWMKDNTTYSPRVINDICCRVRRADSILPLSEDEVYIYYLSQKEEFLSLSCSVKSQIKKAIKFYYQYKRERQ